MSAFLRFLVYPLVFALVGAARLLADSSTAANSDALILSGKFRDCGLGSTQEISRADLLKIPGVRELNEKPSPPVKAGHLTVLPLDDLLEKYPLTADADALVLVCSDRWETFLPAELIAKHHPYLMLLYDGHTPAQGWPVFSKLEGLAPYFCNVSPTLGPKLEGLPEHGEIDATQIVEIRAVNTHERYAPFYEGKMSALTNPGMEGRRIFLQLCNTCHQGPGGVGGNVSQRPFALLQLHATTNVDYFRKFVLNPKQFLPQTIMPAHKDFSEETMGALIAFLSETKNAGVN